MDAPAQNPRRTRFLVVAVIMIAIASTAFWQIFGNPFVLLLERVGPRPPESTPLAGRALPAIFTTPRWTDLRQYGRLPIVVEEQGRENPFVALDAIPKPADRDARRLADIRAIRDALQAHRNAYGAYPTGAVVIGSSEATCLTDAGWQPRSTCVFSVSVVPMPADPGNGAYRYSRVADNYRVAFTLETASGGYDAGDHQLTPEGIK